MNGWSSSNAKLQAGSVLFRSDNYLLFASGFVVGQSQFCNIVGITLFKIKVSLLFVFSNYSSEVHFLAAKLVIDNHVIIRYIKYNANHST